MKTIDELSQLWRDLTQPQEHLLPPEEPKRSGSDKLVCTPTGIDTADGKSLYLCEKIKEESIWDSIQGLASGMGGFLGRSFEEFLRPREAPSAPSPAAPKAAPQAGVRPLPNTP